MTTDRINSYWPAPRRGDDPDAFKPSRFAGLESSCGQWDGEDWIQTERGKIVRYVKPPKVYGSSMWPDLSTCLAIW